MSSRLRLLRRPLALPLLTCLVLAHASAAVVDVELPACRSAPRPITVDGRLDEWAGVEGLVFRPLNAGGSGDLAGERHDLAADLRLAYDERGLLVAVAWRTPDSPRNGTPAASAGDWHRHGDGLELHVAVRGSIVHIACFPGEDGQPLLLARRDDAQAWRDLRAEGGDAAIALAPGGYGQELRVPWTALGVRPDALLGARLRAMIDLAWSALPTPTLATLGPGIRMAATNVTWNVLTAPERVFSRAYLPEPDDWGVLALAGRAAAPAFEDDVAGDGIVALTAPRVPRPPTIDGTIATDEWPAFTRAAYAARFIGRRFACDLALAHDDAALYLAAHLAAPLPTINPEPEREQAGYRGGDCLQLRLARGRRVVNLCAWYDSQRGEPALTADGHDLEHPLLRERGAALAVAPCADGYAMEIALPWSAILPGESAPGDGESLRCAIQPWWAGVDPRFTLVGEIALRRDGPLSVPYALPRAAEVSLGVFAQDGRLLRWLCRADARPGGANVERWDGRDQDGHPLPAGAYHIRGLYHDPVTTQHLLTIGNPGEPPWPTADGTGDWLADESNPQAAATEGAWVYLAAPGSEKGVSVIALDEAGHRRWAVGSDLYPRSVALAVQGDVVYALYAGPELTDAAGRFTGANARSRAVLRCFDKRTGRAARFTADHPTLRVATWPYLERLTGLWTWWNGRSFDPDGYAGQPRYGDCGFGEPGEALGLAATATTVYVSMHTQDRVLAFDALTGEPRPERDIAIERPVGLHAPDDATLIAVSGRRVVRVDLATRAVQAIVDAGLAAPFGVTTDAAGDLYVSDWRDAFQVKVFAPDGAPRRAIGRPGGRPPVGSWDREGMLLPRGIAVTRAGELWVAEDDATPRRVSVWDAATGAFRREYLGPTPYGGGSAFWFDADDPDVVHTLGCAFRLDWSRSSSAPLASELRRMSLDQPFAFDGAKSCSATRLLSHDGEQFVAVGASGNLLVFLRRRGAAWVPAAALGCVHRWATDDGTGRTVWDSDLGTHLVRGMYPSCFHGHVGDNFAWCDRDGDGLVEPEEIAWRRTIFRGDVPRPGDQPEFDQNWGTLPAPDWTVPFSGMCRADGGDRLVSLLRPRGWAASGAPVYDFADATVVGTASGVDALYGTGDGRVIATGAEGGGCDALTCYDAHDGRLLWRLAGVARQGPKDVRATSVAGEWDLPGIGRAVCLWQWHGNWRPYVVTTDGLYVCCPQEEGKLGPAGLWDESFRYFAQRPDGTPLLINGGNDAQHVLAVRGLEHGGRFEAPLVLTAGDAALAATSVPVASAIAEGDPTPIAVRWVEQAPTIDGDLGDWELGRGAAIDGGGGRHATAALARDATDLYLAFHVAEPDPLRNGGTDWRTLFLTGDCVDLMLQTDPAADTGRLAAGAGDVRLLMSIFQDRPIAVLYRPVAPGSPEPVQLMAARLDRVERLDDAVVAVRRRSRGYDLEARVPLRALGLPAGTTRGVRGDVGVIFADATGRDRSLRAYHFNRRTGITADLTTEATLQPHEWGPVLLPLGPNLLRNGGFEAPLATTADAGWCIERQANGMAARPDPDAAHTGRRGLLARQFEAVVYPPAALADPDFDAFLRSANGGAGGGEVVLRQRVPVVAGRDYSLRFFRRVDGMRGGEEKRPGPDRGYATVNVWIEWTGGPGSRLWVANLQDDTDGWVETRDARFNDYGVARPYRAPDGVVSATVSFYLAVNEPLITPTIRLDDVEFVEARP